MVSGLYKIGLGVGAFGMIGLGWLGTALSQSLETPNATASVSWRQILDFFGQENDDQGEGYPRGSRPDIGTCLVSPNDKQTIWHRNPVLVWQGYSTVGIRPTGDGDALWEATVSQKASSGAYQAYYLGEPLEMGQTYDWLFYISEGEPSFWFEFQIMAEVQHEQHGAELEAIQQQLTVEGAGEEAIALAKAEYFMEHNLPADALQEVFAVSEPSVELQEAREGLVQDICDSD